MSASARTPAALARPMRSSCASPGEKGERRRRARTGPTGARDHRAPLTHRVASISAHAPLVPSLRLEASGRLPYVGAEPVQEGRPRALLQGARLPRCGKDQRQAKGSHRANQPGQATVGGGHGGSRLTTLHQQRPQPPFNGRPCPRRRTRRCHGVGRRVGEQPVHNGRDDRPVSHRHHLEALQDPAGARPGALHGQA